MSYGHWEPGQQASPGYGPPGYGAPPPGPPPRTYRAWGIIAAVCGVLFNIILGLPAALIGSRQGKKVAELWASGDVQGAISASRKARTWLIASATRPASTTNRASPSPPWSARHPGPTPTTASTRSPTDTPPRRRP